MKKSEKNMAEKNGAVSAQFFCSACGKPAATVTLVAPGQPDPRLTPVPEGFPPDINMVFIDTPRLSIDGGPRSYTTGVDDSLVERVKAALLAGDARELFAIDREFAPFWCPKCKCCYCRNHCDSEDIFDECFYDATYGTCMRGHRRMLCD
ncbi:MAG: hypothetical protein JW808_11930 [Victivallales bacterium]|nr:hypothetical protein [Victivallales bacterium]